MVRRSITNHDREVLYFVKKEGVFVKIVILLDPQSESGMTSNLGKVDGLIGSEVVCLRQWFIYWGDTTFAT